jgi:hypothetical protein
MATPARTEAGHRIRSSGPKPTSMMPPSLARSLFDRSLTRASKRGTHARRARRVRSVGEEDGGGSTGRVAEPADRRETSLVSLVKGDDPAGLAVDRGAPARDGAGSEFICFASRPGAAAVLCNGRRPRGPKTTPPPRLWIGSECNNASSFLFLFLFFFLLPGRVATHGTGLDRWNKKGLRFSLTTRRK